MKREKKQKLPINFCIPVKTYGLWLLWVDEIISDTCERHRALAVSERGTHGDKLSRWFWEAHVCLSDKVWSRDGASEASAGEGRVAHRQQKHCSQSPEPSTDRVRHSLTPVYKSTEWISKVNQKKCSHGHRLLLLAKYFWAEWVWFEKSLWAKESLFSRFSRF